MFSGKVELIDWWTGSKGVLRNGLNDWQVANMVCHHGLGDFLVLIFSESYGTVKKVKPFSPGFFIFGACHHVKMIDWQITWFVITILVKFLQVSNKSMHILIESTVLTFSQQMWSVLIYVMIVLIPVWLMGI